MTYQQNQCANVLESTLLQHRSGGQGPISAKLKHCSLPGSTSTPMTVESYLKYNLTLAPALSRSLICAVAILAGLTTSAATRPAVADVYSDLSATDRAYVDKLCLPIQYQEGATAFRECVIEQADSASATLSPFQEQLTFDEQFAVQQFCRDSGSAGTDSYKRCTDDQINSVQGVSATDLSKISADENYALQQSCYSIQTDAGVRAYRECLNSGLNDLATVPKPDLSSLSILDKNALQLRCSANHDDAASYRSCLLTAMDGAQATTAIAAEEVPVDIVTPVIPETALAGTPAMAVDTAQEISDDLAPSSDELPELTEQLDTQAAQPLSEAPAAPSELTNTDDVLTPIADNSVSALDTPDTGSIVDRARDTGQSVWAQFQSSVSDLSGMNRMVMLAAMALPFCLLGFWLLMRGRSHEAPYRQESYNRNSALRERVGPSTRHQHNEVEQTEDYPRPIDTQDFDEQVDQLFAQDSPAETWQNAPTRLVEPLDLPNMKKEQLDTITGDLDALDDALDLEEAEQEVEVEQEQEQELEAEAEQHRSAHQAADRGRIAVWLEEQEPAERLSLAIEFMIYWMAYTDERYEPELKQKIFALTDPNKHELIKRWVLKQDTQAFAAITGWLQSNASDDQQEQILSLLIALLVNENALSPTQNTLLRFLSDVFGLGEKKLTALYQDAFEQAMPQLPRVDKPLWWEHQSPDDIKRWDARAISRQSSQIQSRIKLGLPLTGELNEQLVLAHYQRAAHRCDSQRLNLLTHREQMLMDKQLDKIEQVKESLIGEFV